VVDARIEGFDTPWLHTKEKLFMIADLHIHSKYSRACSPELTIAKWCGIKGIDLISTGDFTHPAWFKEIEENLVEEGQGFLKLKNSASPVRFVLGTEVACIYSQGGETRRLHLCLFLPDLASVKKFNEELTKRGCNIRSDGRPILGLSGKEIVKIIKNISPRGKVIPAHAWTPWFAVFGSKSGFDSLEECFEEFAPEIFAIETGLSSDPAMNWRLSALDKIALVSNSDAHSLPNLGREANVFNLDINQIGYDDLFEAIKTKDSKIFLQTIEFYPEEGMYHLDGHRACESRLTPAETKKNKGLCPVCKKPVTVGVYNRVDELADRPEGFMPKNAVPYVSLVELDKIIAEAVGVKSRKSSAVQKEYEKLIQAGGNEFKILLDLGYDELKKITSAEIVEGIRRVREKELTIEPGYDGEYGKVTIFSPKEKKDRQKKLF
jgi:uncharacterized protein (TIGR00375 family)